MKCRLTYIIGAAGFPWFLLIIIGGSMALIVVMVLVMTAELATLVAAMATTLCQLETEKTHSSSATGSPQRHGRALLAFFAPAPLHPASKDRV
jgi:hypothetical protein